MKYEAYAVNGASRRIPEPSPSGLILTALEGISRFFLFPMQCGVIVPILVWKFWLELWAEIVRFTVGFTVGLPSRIHHIIPCLLGVLEIPADEIPQTDEQIERTLHNQQINELNMRQRAILVWRHLNTIQDRFVSYIGAKRDEVLRIPLYSDYVVDRYFIHSPFCVLKRVTNTRSKYHFKGIHIKNNEGFKEWVVKNNAAEQKVEALEDRNKLATVESGEAALLEKQVALREREEVALDERIENVAFVDTFEEVGLTVDGSQIEPAPHEDSIGAEPLRLATQAGTNPSSCPYMQPSIPLPKPKTTATSILTKAGARKSISENLINLKVNGRELKLKISAKPKTAQSSKTYLPSISLDEVQYISAVKDEIKRVLPRPGYDDGSLAPIVFRLAWHCCATYDNATKTGGSNGSTMRFVPEITDEGNTGLDIARAALEPVKQKYPKITYSDLWTLAGCVAVKEMGGPKIDWKCGRFDCRDDKYVPPNGRLPFGYKDLSHVRETFSRMGFNDQEAVALLGAHGVGRCHKRFSGWEGKWTAHPTRFDNEFYKVLVQDQWDLGRVPETDREQYYNHDKSLMMLNTDLELVRDDKFAKWVRVYAEDENLFRADFCAVFAKLLELGIERDLSGKVLPK